MGDPHLSSLSSLCGAEPRTREDRVAAYGLRIQPPGSTTSDRIGRPHLSAHKIITKLGRKTLTPYSLLWHEIFLAVDVPPYSPHAATQLRLRLTFGGHRGGPSRHTGVEQGVLATEAPPVVTEFLAETRDSSRLHSIP
jgi:hypothetical protein